ncbi:Leucine-rich repeat protein SHOC-2 [Nymphon striatum]|nr:Leucine-rich repeat protein SHOC-2 [Nymphon striatum]
MNHEKIRESVSAFNARCALLDISFSGRHDDIDEEKSGQTASPNKHTLLLTKVTLPNIPIKTFFTNLKHLTSIILDDIRLSAIPEEVGLHFPNLENLSLNENCLTSLPKMIGNLKNLKTLSFRKNNITELPYTFKCLCRLEFLDASSNELSEVPGKEMPLLSELLLANNSIHEFIVEKNDFKSLKTLDLSQNSLECIHGPFLAINNLTKLYLYDNNLNEFPAFLTRLEKITELDIGQNSIDILPEQFESYPVITKLHISYNNIKEFPIWFFQLSSIKNLSFCCNPLEQSCFNDFKMENFSNVESINAHYCEDCEIHNINIPYDILPSLPDEFGFLKNIIDLNLSGIKLKTVPNSIGSMQSLTGLYLNNNLIKCLPETICHLTSLKYFHISSNKLKELPESFGNLTSLQTFVVNDNYVRTRLD